MDGNAAIDKKDKIVLAAMASGHSNEFSPVQVQKMFFLLDRNLGEQIGGPHFNFEPHDYGPFDPNVYEEIKRLSDKGLATICGFGATRRYALTASGFEVGKSQFKEFSEHIQQYIGEVSKFVQKHSFTTLVTSIYKAYPEMKINSVFRS